MKSDMVFACELPLNTNLSLAVIVQANGKNRRFVAKMLAKMAKSKIISASK
jgi:hypothetical protein